MKWKIFVLLGLFAVSLTAIAQVLLTNLDQKSFVIDVTGPPTNVANLNLRRSQFSPSTTGWFITNVTGVTGISTNISTNDLWTIDGFGDLHPNATNSQVTVTNLVVASNLVATGEFTLQKKSQLLVLGTNVLGSGVSSMFYLISPTNDASQVVISLDDGASPGQLLLLVNYTNGVPANGAFTLPANSLVSGGGHVIQPGDWVATNTFSALYTWQSPDWIMIDAFAANGQSVFQTNYFQNIVVYSNITLRGNSTLTINNITLTTNDLWHTNLVGGAATLQPVNLGLQPLVGKGWLSGTNTPASGLLPLALPFNVLSSVRSEDIGDPSASYMYIAQARNNNNPKSFLSFVASTNALAFQLGANDGTDQSTMNFVTANGSDMQLTLQKNSTNFTLLYPTRAATLTPYVFDTDKTHTTNNMMDFRNGSSLTAQWESSGQWDFGLDTVNFTPTVFGLGKLTQFAYLSNSLPDNSLDTLGGIRLRTSFTATPSTPAWSAPISWIGTGWSTNNAGAEEVRFSAYVAPTSGSSHPSGTFFIQGSSNELSPHTVFGLSLYSGYTGTGTNVFLDNGMFGAVPGGGGVVATNYPALPQPSAPSVSIHGTPGTNTYAYAIGWINLVGQGLASYPAVTITNGPDILSTTNYIVIDPGPCPVGAIGFQVWRTVNSAGAGFLVGLLNPLGTCGVIYNDTGLTSNDDSLYNYFGSPVFDLSQGWAFTNNFTINLSGTDNLKGPVYIGTPIEGFGDLVRLNTIAAGGVQIAEHFTNNQNVFFGNSITVESEHSGLIALCVAAYTKASTGGEYFNAVNPTIGYQGTNTLDEMSCVGATVDTWAGPGTVNRTEMFRTTTPYSSGVASPTVLKELIGYFCGDYDTGVNNNFAYYSEMNAATNKWAFYGAGTAKSHFGGLVEGQTGYSSLATETGAITSTGWTNSIGKDADVAFDGTTITYKLADGAGTFWYTNTTAVGHDSFHLQSGGKMIVTGGTNLVGFYHAH